jgi:hypothetical protein
MLAQPSPNYINWPALTSGLKHYIEIKEWANYAKR